MQLTPEYLRNTLYKSEKWRSKWPIVEIKLLRYVKSMNSIYDRKFQIEEYKEGEHLSEINWYYMREEICLSKSIAKKYF